MFSLICLLIFQPILLVVLSKQANVEATRQEKKQNVNTPNESSWSYSTGEDEDVWQMQTTNTGIGEDLTSCFLVVFSKSYFIFFTIHRKETPLFLPRPLHKEDLDCYLAHLQHIWGKSQCHISKVQESSWWELSRALSVRVFLDKTNCSCLVLWV